MDDLFTLESLAPLDDLRELAAPAAPPAGDEPAAQTIYVAPDGTATLRQDADALAEGLAADLALFLQSRGVSPDVARRALQSFESGELKAAIDDSVRVGVGAGLVEAVLGTDYARQTPALQALASPDVMRALAAAKQSMAVVDPITLDNLVDLQRALGVDGAAPGAGRGEDARTIRALTEMFVGGTNVATAAINNGALDDLRRIDWAQGRRDTQSAIRAARVGGGKIGAGSKAAASAAARRAGAGKTAATPYVRKGASSVRGGLGKAGGRLRGLLSGSPYGGAYDPLMYDVVASACMGLAMHDRRDARSGLDIGGLTDRFRDLLRRKKDGKITPAEEVELGQVEDRLLGPEVEVDPVALMEEELEAYAEGAADAAVQDAKRTGDLKGSLIGGFQRMLGGLTGGDGVIAKVTDKVKELGGGAFQRTKVAGGAIVTWVREATAKYWQRIIDEWMPQLKETMGVTADKFFNTTLPGLIERLPELMSTLGTVTEAGASAVNVIASLVGVVGNFLGEEMPARAALPADEATGRHMPPAIVGSEDAPRGNPWGHPDVGPVVQLVRRIDGDMEAARGAAAWVAHYVLPELAAHFRGSAYVDAVASALRFATQLMSSVGDIKAGDGSMRLHGLAVAAGVSAIQNVKYYAGGSGTPLDAPPYRAPGGDGAVRAAANALLAMLWQSVQDPSMPVYGWVGDAVKAVVGADYGGEDDRGLAGAALFGSQLAEQLYYRADAASRAVVVGALIDLLDGPLHFLGGAVADLRDVTTIRVDPGNDWDAEQRRVDRMVPGPAKGRVPRVKALVSPAVLRAYDALVAAELDAPDGSTVHVFGSDPGSVVLVQPETPFGYSLERRAYRVHAGGMAPLTDGARHLGGKPAALHEHEGLRFQLYE